MLHKVPYGYEVPYSPSMCLLHAGCVARALLFALWPSTRTKRDAGLRLPLPGVHAQGSVGRVAADAAAGQAPRHRAGQAEQLHGR